MLTTIVGPRLNPVYRACLDAEAARAAEMAAPRRLARTPAAVVSLTNRPPSRSLMPSSFRGYSLFIMQHPCACGSRPGSGS